MHPDISLASTDSAERCLRDSACDPPEFRRRPATVQTWSGVSTGCSRAEEDQIFVAVDPANSGDRRCRLWRRGARPPALHTSMKDRTSWKPIFGVGDSTAIDVPSCRPGDLGDIAQCGTPPGSAGAILRDHVEAGGLSLDDGMNFGQGIGKARVGENGVVCFRRGKSRRSECPWEVRS